MIILPVIQLPTPAMKGPEAIAVGIDLLLVTHSPGLPQRFMSKSRRTLRYSPNCALICANGWTSLELRSDP